MKISVYKQKFILLVAQNYFANEIVIVRHFDHHDEAAAFIEQLAIEE